MVATLEEEEEKVEEKKRRGGNRRDEEEGIGNIREGGREKRQERR